MVRRLGRSQQLLVTALAEQETVAVLAVVENHLGRRPTRSELHAAQRLAHLLAQRAAARLAMSRSGPACTRQGLAISRPRQWPDDWLDQGDDADRREAVRWTESRRDAGRRQRGSAGGSKSSWTPLPSMSWSACVPCSKVI